MVGGLGFEVARVYLFRFFGIGFGPLSVILVFGIGPLGFSCNLLLDARCISIKF